MAGRCRLDLDGRPGGDLFETVEADERRRTVNLDIGHRHFNFP
jgi:hypothetical protein